ncbi:MAG: ATP-binding protein, partial [Deltaproteobacteria bacterium]|nr:ATP-binding protein [Deltaproteobacteria bacterium]
MLLGPRQTGKSTLIKILKPELTINLADEGEFLLFTQNPDELKQRLASTQYKTVFIDEVQRLPGLLNTVQSILDDQDNMIKFYLTGSSARKLKRGKANLLPGRVFNYQLGPLVTSELNYRIDTEKALSTGTMPGVYSENNPKFRYKTLRSYASTYLKEEIQAEALARNLEGFSRFLYFAAIYSGHFLDISKLASEAQVPRQSAVRYFEILEDTLIVNRSPS